MARRTPPPQLIGSGLIPETFQKDYAGVEDEYQGKLAGFQRDERGLFADYGFSGGIGADGAVNFQADPNANYGLYQQLLQNIGGQLGQARNEVRGRGIGRAGLAKARENLIRFMMSGEKTGLLTNFNKGAANIFGQRGAALTDRNRGFTEVEGKALDWWNQYGPDDPDGNVGVEDSRPAENPVMPSYSPNANNSNGYDASMELAEYLAAKNPTAAYSADPNAYAQPVYSPPMPDPYYPQPAGPVRRQRVGGGGGGPMQVM